MHWTSSGLHETHQDDAKAVRRVSNALSITKGKANFSKHFVRNVALSVVSTKKKELTYEIIIIFLSGFFFHHLSQFTEEQGKRGWGGGATSLTPLYHSHLLHKHFDISWAITVERSPLSTPRVENVVEISEIFEMFLKNCKYKHIGFLYMAILKTCKLYIWKIWWLYVMGEYVYCK